MSGSPLDYVLFANGGELGREMSALDWAQTPEGPPASWPSGLRNAVRNVLTSRFSMWAAYGPELTTFYNDAYRRDTVQATCPWALGRPAREVWAEIWHGIGPRIQSVLDTGIAARDEDLQLFLERSGYPEETYHTFSYSGAARPRRGSGRHPQRGQRLAAVAIAGSPNLVANQIGSGRLNAGSYEDERLRAEALAELDRAKTDFFSNVSHGFRTPLTLIMGPVAARLAERPAGARVELDLGWASYLPSAGVGMIVLVLAGSADVLAAGTTESVAEPPRG